MNGITTSILLTLQLPYFQYHKTSFSWKILYKYFRMFYVLEVHQYGHHTNQESHNHCTDASGYHMTHTRRERNKAAIVPFTNVHSKQL
jgi:hypothetical protein